jgi:predicted nucleotide-binding protein (sugar kinase/HSP70/actin superfamily)
MLPVSLVSFFFLDQKKNPAIASKRNASAETLAATAITVSAFLDLLVEPAYDLVTVSLMMHNSSGGICMFTYVWPKKCYTMLLRKTSKLSTAAA